MWQLITLMLLDIRWLQYLDDKGLFTKMRHSCWSARLLSNLRLPALNEFADCNDVWIAIADAYLLGKCSGTLHWSQLQSMLLECTHVCAAWHDSWWCLLPGAPLGGMQLCASAGSAPYPLLNGACCELLGDMGTKLSSDIFFTVFCCCCCYWKVSFCDVTSLRIFTFR